MKMKLTIILIFLFSIISPAELEIKVIEEPFPTSHGIEKAIPIIETGVVEELPGEKTPAFAGILSATVDDQGNFYFFDYRSLL